MMCALEVLAEINERKIAREKAEEEARKKAEEEARKRAEEEARKKAEEEAREAKMRRALAENLSKNKEVFLKTITDEMITKEKTCVTFELKYCSESNSYLERRYGLNKKELICFPTKVYYANNRWSGYRWTGPERCCLIKEIVEELEKVCFKVKFQEYKSDPYYTHSKKNLTETINLLKMTVSIDPECLEKN